MLPGFNPLQAVGQLADAITGGDTPEPAPPKSGQDGEFLLQFFAYAHLPAALQEVSRPFCQLAEALVANLPRNPERTVALRKLLEAKDCAVRARLAK